MPALRWLVTAGPTCEDIDPVRFISNRSSGRMGYAVAKAVLERGEQVVLVSGPVSIEAPRGAELVRVRSTRDMRGRVLERFGETDVLVMAAAVADFRPRSPSPTKLNRTGRFTLELEPTEDILAELGTLKQEWQVLVGFALESPEPSSRGITEQMRERAARKLAEKHLDLIVLNGPQAIGSDESEVAVLGADGRWSDWSCASKEFHAKRLVELAARLALARQKAFSGKGRNT